MHVGDSEKVEEIFGNIERNVVSLHRIIIIAINMEPKIGDKMKVSPQLTAQPDWIDGEVIDVEHNPFMGLVISIKDKLGRIFFGQSRFFIAL
jgi:hypothetical protein